MHSNLVFGTILPVIHVYTFNINLYKSLAIPLRALTSISGRLAGGIFLIRSRTSLTRCWRPCLTARWRTLKRNTLSQSIKAKTLSDKNVHTNNLRGNCCMCSLMTVLYYDKTTRDIYQHDHTIFCQAQCSKCNCIWKLMYIGCNSDHVVCLSLTVL